MTYYKTYWFDYLDDEGRVWWTTRKILDECESQGSSEDGDYTILQIVDVDEIPTDISLSKQDLDELRIFADLGRDIPELGEKMK